MSMEFHLGADYSLLITCVAVRKPVGGRTVLMDVLTPTRDIHATWRSFCPLATRRLRGARILTAWKGRRLLA